MYAESPVGLTSTLLDRSLKTVVTFLDELGAWSKSLLVMSFTRVLIEGAPEFLFVAFSVKLETLFLLAEVVCSNLPRFLKEERKLGSRTSLC